MTTFAEELFEDSGEGRIGYMGWESRGFGDGVGSLHYGHSYDQGYGYGSCELSAMGYGDYSYGGGDIGGCGVGSEL